MSNTETYITLLQRALDEIPQPLEELSAKNCSVHMIVNLTQGVLLQHLVERIAEYYGVQDEEFENRLSFLVTDMFRQELFEPFREKINENPQLVVQVAKRLVSIESKRLHRHLDPERVNALYISIFLRYLQYDNLNTIIERLQSDTAIQGEILDALLRGWLGPGLSKHLQPFQNHSTPLFMIYSKYFHPHMLQYYRFLNMLKNERLGLLTKPFIRLGVG